MLSKLQSVLGDSLKLGDCAKLLALDSPLFGHLPELDSLAVVRLIGAVEERFEIEVYDDEVTARLFESMAGGASRHLNLRAERTSMLEELISHLTASVPRKRWSK